uniref:Transmembrane protein n=1 Tax=Opuntia streptacantha TaxID=393608 RepID=A0A7C9AN54_OPUST
MVLSFGFLAQIIVVLVLKRMVSSKYGTVTLLLDRGSLTRKTRFIMLARVLELGMEVDLLCTMGICTVWGRTVRKHTEKGFVHSESTYLQKTTTRRLKFLQGLRIPRRDAMPGMVFATISSTCSSLVLGSGLDLWMAIVCLQVIHLIGSFLVVVLFLPLSD